MNFYLCFLISILNASLNYASEDNSLNNDESDATTEFDSSTFENEITEGKPHFVMFYAPWCGHCKKLHPMWHQLSEKYQDKSGLLKIGKVDCTQQTPLCVSQEINGYPTLKFYAKGPENGLKYKGPRDLSSMEKFIAEQLGIEYHQDDDETPNAISGLVEFTDTTFTDMIKHGRYFVKFYAPWCGHCQRLAPTWDLLAKSLQHDKAVIIGKLDCTEYKSSCADFEVKGYPTLLWIEDGKKVAKYSGDRSHEDLKRFVTEQLGGRTVKKEELKEVATVVTLTAENFENAVSHGVTFVMFFAPWCGHCKRLAPTFEELGKKFAALESVTIAKVDCTQQVNKDLCTEQEVDGFPTLYLYKDGVRILTYNGDRSLVDMAEFVSSKLEHDEL